MLPHMLHAVFVRSPVAHARIRSVDLSRAAAAPGVAFVLGGAELRDCCRRCRNAALAAEQMDGARAA